MEGIESSQEGSMLSLFSILILEYTLESLTRQSPLSRCVCHTTYTFTHTHTTPHSIHTPTPTHHTQFTHNILQVPPLTKLTPHTLNSHTNTYMYYTLVLLTVAPFIGSSPDFSRWEQLHPQPATCLNIRTL